MNYSLKIVDIRSDDAIWFLDTLEGVDKMLAAFAQSRRPGSRARMERLAAQLVARFPPMDYAGEEEPLDSAWRCSRPVEEARELAGPVWAPAISAHRAGEFMAALLPLARELCLDVHDSEAGIYYSHEGRVIPPERTGFWHSTDPTAAQLPRYAVTLLLKRLVLKLTPALAAQGFVLTPHPTIKAYYRREIEGGAQTIWPSLSHAVPHTTCTFHIATHSRRFGALRRALNAWHRGKSASASEATESISLPDLSSLRRALPVWQHAPLGSAEYMRTAAEVDWMVEDLLALALPLLDQARSVQGMNRLLNGAAHGAQNPANFHSENSARTGYAYWLLLPYARLAGDAQFDTIARTLLNHPRTRPPLPDMPSVQDWVNYCRERVAVVGDGPA